MTEYTEEDLKFQEEMKKIQDDLNRQHAFYLKFRDEKRAAAVMLKPLIKEGRIERQIAKMHIPYSEPALVQKVFDYMIANPVSELIEAEISIRDFSGKILKSATIKAKQNS